jgi:YYY domain-containing protein
MAATVLISLLPLSSREAPQLADAAPAGTPAVSGGVVKESMGVLYDAKRSQRKRTFQISLSFVLTALVLLGTIFQGLALLNVYSQPNTRVQASRWMYQHLPSGSKLTYEQWDDALPVPVDGHTSDEFMQMIYTNSSGQPTAGMDLYGDDTSEKARWLADFLPTVDAITMASDRLYKSIPRLPFRYPLTIRYYQLLFSNQLGFQLVAEFKDPPHLLGITLDDSGADESYSVFDHPTVRIFKRQEPYPYTSDQLFEKLMQGLKLPAGGAQLSGAQASLLLTPAQIDDNQSSPPFGSQFPVNSLSNQYPALFWWLALFMLGLLVYPLFWLPLRGLADRGYIFSKLGGLLLLAYGGWLLASAHLLPFERFSLWLVVALLAACGLLALFWQRHFLLDFIRQRWRFLALCELLFSLAYLLFILIRSYNPDLWHPIHGGEKPMELAFLNAVLRSPYLPPLDPWFAGGYINYYYYGYVIISALIKLTGILPTTAFNLAIPTLFALAFSGAIIIVYSLTHSLFAALLGGFFAVLVGNFDGLTQLIERITAALQHLPLPMFDYWRSSRVIPYTINEFPFWTFLFADLHPHVINIPITIGMLGVCASLLLTPVDRAARIGLLALYALAAFLFGTLICVNTWDMPVYMILLAATLCLRVIRAGGLNSWVEVLIALSRQLLLTLVLCGLGYLCYLPFFGSYQQLYVNGVGLVTQGSEPGPFLIIFGLWMFVTLSFFIFELYRQKLFPFLSGRSTLWIVVSRGLLVILLLASLYFGVRALLLLAILSGGIAFVALLRRNEHEEAAAPRPLFTYLLLLMGLCLCLGIEVVYIRDFLDGGDYARMNTYFKFSMQAWICLAIGGALAVYRLWQAHPTWLHLIWRVSFAFLLIWCSFFLIEGTSARTAERLAWYQAQQPLATSVNYTPTLDGFAFVRAWYPEDADAITWLNQHVSGSPVILEATMPVSYQWYNRVSVYTGLPDVLGWPGHEESQRYASQPLNRLTDIGLIYSTTDMMLALNLLHHYNVRYIYIGPLERTTYAENSTIGLDKFQQLVGIALQVVYDRHGVLIYEVLA